MSTIEMMRTRGEFLEAVKGLKVVTPGFILQARDRDDGESVVHQGFTCSKKIGNAVARNLAKRRLREVARAVLPDTAQPGWDYVLIGRSGQTGTRDLTVMTDELKAAMTQLHPSLSERSEMDDMGLN